MLLINSIAVTPPSDFSFEFVIQQWFFPSTININLRILNQPMHRAILNKLGSFNEEEIGFFEQEIRERHVQKDQLLVAKGEVAKSIFYSLKGNFYQYQTGENREKNIIDLHLENEWFLAHTSFLSQEPSESYLAAFSAGSMLELSLVSLHYLIARSISFIQFNKIMDKAVSRLYIFDHSLSPLEKYLHLLRQAPEVLQHFPLKIIASYLKITPETLSRTREKIVRPNTLS